MHDDGTCNRLNGPPAHAMAVGSGATWSLGPERGDGEPCRRCDISCDIKWVSCRHGPLAGSCCTCTWMQQMGGDAHGRCARAMRGRRSRTSCAFGPPLAITWRLDWTVRRCPGEHHWAQGRSVATAVEGGVACVRDRSRVGRNVSAYDDMHHGCGLSIGVAHGGRGNPL